MEETNVRFIKFKDDYRHVEGFSNVGIVYTTEGIVIIDTNIDPGLAEQIYKAIRQETSLPIRYMIYTHGHYDHLITANAYLEKGTTIIAHEAVNDRFLKYQKLADHTNRINQIQFQGQLPIRDHNEAIPPDVTFHKTYSFTLGDKTFHLIHGKGETDDHCYVWIPKDKVVYSGDFMISSFPNIGNPLKVNRFEREWFERLEDIQKLQPNALFPGHGSLIQGNRQIMAATQDVVDALKLVYDETSRCLNENRPLEDALEQITLPEHLAKSPYLPQNYGSLDFAIKGTYRRYTGWFSGNPTDLEPHKKLDVAKEYIALIGDKESILDRCRALFQAGEYQMVMHIADVLIFAENNAEAIQLKKDAINKKKETVTNFISKNIYNYYGS
ncbi:MBL fold metallo-hydrolase [Alkalihalobacillus sp. LMS6]|uniref:alkyl sulfatase dimerization domain-containing protein n=1 Tax=Alkalihalobacillus sp. LMS6 TaxID=2924034 RepID=UPI0020D02B70|nr:alkyl sulfatase dimerization domain-containing protein [Alkalihalobacillus sp. LMS6]UTR04669.1 MBL fold metallo-hydrolase [Alkalihalobacillus sp. LMS6]